MSWRDKLQPASFRGVPFQIRSHNMRRGLRGAHHIYPNRDTGWVEFLGKIDPQTSFDAFVIGDDYMDVRDKLIAALETPTAGELIHPYFGARQVVPMPGGYSVTESAAAGRQARFTMSFVEAFDSGVFPQAEKDQTRKTEDAADTVDEVAVEVSADRLDLDGIIGAVEDAIAFVDFVFDVFDGVRAVINGVINFQQTITGAIFGAFAKARGYVRSFLKVADSFNAFKAMISGLASGLSGRAPLATLVELPGVRPVARPVTTRIDADTAEAAAAAAIAMLQALRTQPAPPGLARFAANRDVIENAVTTVLVTQLTRATPLRIYDSHEAAIAAMKEVEAEIEALLRREARQAKPSDDLTNALSDMRAALRDAMMSKAADLRPIRNIELGESLPSLAAAWRIDGTIDAADEIAARNEVPHPLFLPQKLTVKARTNV